MSAGNVTLHPIGLTFSLQSAVDGCASHQITHYALLISHCSSAAAAGNLIPVPGVGLATDTVTMTTMAMALAAVFGGSITESVAKNMAINAIVATVKQQPVKVIAKEISKLVPIVGQLVAPSVSVAMLESAGRLLADELASERDLKLPRLTDGKI